MPIRRRFAVSSRCVASKLLAVSAMKAAHFLKLRTFLPMLCVLASPAYAQTPGDKNPQIHAGPIALYVDCRDFECDDDYIRTEIPFATHVRDRRDADVYVLITSEATAAGGQEARLAFIGQGRFEGLEDTLQYVSPPAASEDQVREGLKNTITRGLVRYLNQTSLAQDLTVMYVPSAPASTSLRDAWKRWTFALTANTYINGEQSLKSSSVSGSISATRVTDALKVNASVHGDYSSNSFAVQQGRNVVSHQRSFGFTAIVAPSVNQHMSIGVRMSGVSSTFLNQTLTLRVAPAIELNAFRYSEANRRMLIVEYSAGVTAFDYEERTLFGKLSERLPSHNLLVSLLLRQPWGSVGLAAEGSQYLHDYKQNRAIVGGNMDWNIARGLSFVTTVHAAHIRDQVFLPARGLTDEEILLRQRQLATSYSYSASVGVSYTFGSRFAAVVNRRFAGSAGGTMFVQ